MEKHLVTFSASFKAPDGKSYNHAWGKVEFKNKSWPDGVATVMIGASGKELTVSTKFLVAAVRCDEKPKTERHTVPIDSIQQENINPNIYIAE